MTVSALSLSTLRAFWRRLTDALYPLPRWLAVAHVAALPVVAVLARSAGTSGWGVWALMVLFGSLAALTLLVARRGYSRVVGALRETRDDPFASHRARIDSSLGPLGEEVREILQTFQKLRNEVVANQFSAVKAMALSLEARDVYTQGHCLRVRTLVRRILDRLGVDVETRKPIELAAMLHDIGKLGVPDRILLKESPLTEDERRRARLHVEIGVEILQSLQAMGEVATYVKHHHERFDGEGYPEGLAGADIPLGSRIIAVADVIDAMRSSRPYREALSIDACIEELDRIRGAQLDPQLVDVAIGMLRTQSSTQRVAAEVLGAVEA